MQFALAQAQRAAAEDEVPVGAVIVYQQQIIGQGYNHREKDQQVTGHAEMMAMTQASRHLKSWRLLDCTLYVTLEPCMMCAGALIQSRISRIVYAVNDPKSGAIHSILKLEKIPHVGKAPQITTSVMESEATTILKTYFQKKRHEKT